MTLRLLRTLLLAAAGAGALGALAHEAVAQDQFHDDTPVHVAGQGDTLWGLSELYFGNSQMWPQLWAWNPHVTNPHWIYPGDVIFLGPRALRPADGPARHQAAALPDSAGLYFPLGGFYTSTEIPSVGTLRFARADRRLLQPLDEVYLEFEEPENVRIGDEYVINRVEGRIQDRRETVAVKYRTTGRVRVTQAHESTPLFSAEITDLYDTIERDDLLFVAQPQILLVEPRENTVDLEGEIIDRLDPIRFMHQFHTVFIDLGQNDGVRVGNRFFMWQREDMGESIRLAREGRAYQEEVRSLLPWQFVGEAMAIYVGENYSTAVILTANVEVSVGQRITLQAGH
ncbi:MAG: LysM domain-containing protein [Deltaproteobacteria bacterium]|nr:MAG: LysM domain-containing protein [Deltaproteobacteria bacterium]